MLFANVAVTSPTNPKWKLFTYSVPSELQDKIKTGQYILVPWGRKETQAVVISLTKATPIEKVKPITKIIFLQPILKDHQIELLNWLSYYYAAAYPDCLNLFLPEFPANLFKVNLSEQTPKLPQRLILVPNLNQIPQALAKIQPKSSYLIFHHDLPKLVKFSRWQQVYNGQTETIVGSRSAVFLPFANLKEIVIMNEHDPSYKEERSPYYHSFKVALKLRELLGIKLIVEDSIPQVTTFYLAKTANQSKKIILRRHFTKSLQKYLIIDMTIERRLGNYALISEPLANYLLYILKHKLGPVLLYLNRKSEAGNIFCRSCQTTQLVEKEPETCPNCQSPAIFFSSLNLAKLGKEVANLTGNTNYQLVTERENQAVPLKPIVLATSAIFSKAIINQFSLVAVVSADTSLNLADFSSQETTFQFLAKLSLLPIKKLPKLPQMIVQTFNPKLPLIKQALNLDYAAFYRDEIKQRQSLGYPPFSILAKLSLSLKDEEKVAKLADELYQQLSRVPANFQIIGPVASFRRLSQKPRWNIILKAQKREDLDLPLVKVPSNWTVNIDPINLL